MHTHPWTVEEDRLLSALQSEHGNRWSIIAKHITGRTGQQCAQRWRHKVNPEISKEKWTEEEDRKLLQYYKKNPGKWAQIAQGIPGRTDQQCMARYLRHLDPSISRDQWTEEEDRKLLQSKEKEGNKWSAISRSLPGRTPQQCRARWFAITRSKQRRGTDAPASRSDGMGKPMLLDAVKGGNTMEGDLDAFTPTRVSSGSCLQGGPIRPPPSLPSPTFEHLQGEGATGEGEPMTPSLRLPTGFSVFQRVDTYSSPGPTGTSEPIKLTEEQLSTMTTPVQSWNCTYPEDGLVICQHAFGPPQHTQVGAMQSLSHLSPLLLESLNGSPCTDMDSPEWASLKALLDLVGNETRTPIGAQDVWKAQIQGLKTPYGTGNLLGMFQTPIQHLQPQDFPSPLQLLANSPTFLGQGVEPVNLSGM